MTKILVIEDAESLRNDIMEMLSFEGFDVAGAENGKMGVELAKSYTPDLIICDIMMPELDGYGVLDALQQDAGMFATPFIFLTAKTDRSDVRHGMGLGADDYLTKPFVASELLNAISARLKKKDEIGRVIDDSVRESIEDITESIISALPHELRTPLNTIIGFSDMLITQAERLTSKQVIEWSKHINVAGQRLYRLVENYLMYVRAEVLTHNPSEREELQSKRVDHPSTIVQFQATQKAQQENRMDDLEIALVDDCPVKISDHDLGKIVEELVDNAIKFSEQGTAIQIKAALEGNNYVMRIIDTGIGMTAKQVDSIGVYRQFERLLYEQQGTGLGLAIVNLLVKLYDGEMTINSSKDKGTEVVIRLQLIA